MNSDSPENSKFYDKTFNKVIDKFKDEVAGVIIEELIGLRSKIFSYIKANDDNSKTAERIKILLFKKIYITTILKDTIK